MEVTPRTKEKNPYGKHQVTKHSFCSVIIKNVEFGSKFDGRKAKNKTNRERRSFPHDLHPHTGGSIADASRRIYNP